MITRTLTRKITSSLLVASHLFLAACQNNATAQQTAAPEPTPAAPPAPRSIKLALILDTSGSMDGLIEQAKSQLWNIVNELALAKCDGVKPNLNIALYQYGNDGIPASEGYIQMISPLTDDLDEISENLFALTTNGGSEFCGQAIQTSLKQLDWDANPDDYKVIFIAGNEPFTQGRVDYREVCSFSRGKGILVNTIHCGDFQTGINGAWQEGARLGGGKYMSIDHNSKTEYVESPYDDRIAHLNDSLNATYLAYGNQGRVKMQNMMEQDANSESYSQVNKVKRAVTKSSHVYKTESWDLVEASKKEDFQVESVEEELLPEEMKAMDNSEKKAYIQKQSQKREVIQKEIQTLNTKRKTYVA
ncbi:MAG: vWA domain-containing protein, partial [Owenweeksia sp.]